MIKYIVKKQKITLIFFGMCILLGIYNFASLPKQEMPDVVPMGASVTTVYPGPRLKESSKPLRRFWNRKLKKCKVSKQFLPLRQKANPV